MDWREDYEKSQNIKLKDETNYSKTAEVKPDEFLNEYYLCGEGRYLVENYSKIPRTFGKYIESMKNLAWKIAINQGEFDVSQEVEIINTYGEFGASSTQTKGENFSDKKSVSKIYFDDFYNRLKEAEVYVKPIENNFKTKEGSPQGASSESRG